MNLDAQTMTALTGGLGFLIGAASAILLLRRQAPHTRSALLVGALVALVVNVVYFTRAIAAQGFNEALRHNFESTLLLATMIGLVGIGTYLTAALRGVDGFLFALAGILQFAALTVTGEARQTGGERPWFISHGLAFALSGTCFVAGGAAGLAYLTINHFLRHKRAAMIVGTVASLESLERFGRWMLIVGFPLFSYGMLTGVCGIYHPPDTGARAEWFRDPFIIFSFVTWALYGYLFWAMLFQPRIRGSRAARLATAGMGLIVVVFLFAELISPLHR